MKKILFILCCILLVSCSKKENTEIETEDRSTTVQEIEEIKEEVEEIYEKPDPSLIKYFEGNNGGNINSRKMEYADAEFLEGILDFNNLKHKENPKTSWATPLDNTFNFCYLTGECRMIPPEFLIDAAEKLGVESTISYDWKNHEMYCLYDLQLIGIFVQKISSEYFVRAFYQGKDIVPEKVKDGTFKQWYLNKEPVSITQKVYFNDGTYFIGFNDVYTEYKTFSYSIDEPDFFGFKLFGNFNVLGENLFCFTSHNYCYTDDLNKGNSQAYFFRLDKNPTAWYYLALFDSRRLMLVDSGEDIKTNFKCNGTGLIENNDIFKYSIINMFDNNPETSFVEDSEDDNISFNLQYEIEHSYIKGFKIINGYAKNEDTYFKNNQVKTLEIICLDKVFSYTLEQTLEPQFFELDLRNGYNIEVYSTEIYPGTKYSDTCIAEFDILTIDGWIIGDSLCREKNEN